MTSRMLQHRAVGRFAVAALVLALGPASLLAQDRPPSGDRPGMPAPPSLPLDRLPGAGEPPAAAPNAKGAPGQKGAAGAAKPGSAHAGDPQPDQAAKLLDELYARLRTATDERAAAEVAVAIEQLWQHSGSPTADLLVARAAAATEANRRDLAMRLLNAAVELQPDYAEAWNRRAYLFYLEDDYKRALGDLRRVLALEPHHFKALEGLANILQHLGEKKAALEAYESLLKVHPNAPGVRKVRDDLKVEVEGQGI